MAAAAKVAARPENKGKMIVDHHVPASANAISARRCSKRNRSEFDCRWSAVAGRLADSILLQFTTNYVTTREIMAEQKATNITWHEGSVTRDEREKLLGQKGVTVWMTGLSASRQITIAVILEQMLLHQKKHAYRLDGDNIRMGLNKNLGFSAEDRAENIRRIGEVAKLFADAGVIAITSFICPYQKDRDAVRASMKPGEFIEVYVNVSPRSRREARPQGPVQESPRRVAAGKGWVSPASTIRTKRRRSRRSSSTPKAQARRCGQRSSRTWKRAGIWRVEVEPRSHEDTKRPVHSASRNSRSSSCGHVRTMKPLRAFVASWLNCFMSFVDLHCHSTASDGTLPPREVVRLAKQTRPFCDSR